MQLVTQDKSHNSLVTQLVTRDSSLVMQLVTQLVGRLSTPTPILRWFLRNIYTLSDLPELDTLPPLPPLASECL